MKKILIATCILSLATISPVFAKNITTSAYKIASAGYTSSSSNGPGSGTIMDLAAVTVGLPVVTTVLAAATKVLTDKRAFLAMLRNYNNG